MPGPSRDPSRRFSRAHRPGDAGNARPAVTLPAANDLDPPPPPPGACFDADEQATWQHLWRSGESTQWTDADLVSVAALVKSLSRVYAGRASTADHSAVGRLLEGLGLTPAARLRLGWEVATDE
ncbi:phage terminase small subunit [Micromonospora sp. NPDC005161]